MELKWLEDYLALAEYHSFSKAAEARFVTQPAFGRRIKALENWLGVELVDRQQYPTTLTPLGREFVEEASQWVEQFYNSRAQLRERQSTTKRVVFVSQHSLSGSFFPKWSKPLQTLVGDVCLRVNAGNLHDILDTLLSGQGDFLLCYHSPEIFPQLEQDDILNLQVGVDQLIPVSAADQNGHPIHAPVPGARLKLLAYPQESFFGRLLQRDCFSRISPAMQFNIVCENALVEGLKAMALAANGVAWLPARMIEQELQQGSLVSIHDRLPAIEMKIMLYRKKTPRLIEIEVFWDYFKTQASV